MSVTIQVRQRGTITLPARLREKYQIVDGDVFTLIDLDGLLVLAPKVSSVPKLVGEIERLREEAGLSVGDLIEGLEQERQHSRQTGNAG